MDAFEKFFSRNYRVFLALFILVLVGYANVLHGPLLFDDEHFIEKNTTVRNFDVAKIYTTGVTQGAGIGGNFYRPNQQLVFAIIYSLFKLNPVPYHLVSVLFHLLNALLLFLLLIRLDFRRTGALLASLVFVIHPVLTEAVSYISGLADPLGLFFLLTGMILWVDALKHVTKKRKIRDYILPALFFIAALFSKENMVIFLPLSLLTMVYLLHRKKNALNRFVLISLAVFTLITLGYLYLKFGVFNFTGSVGLTEEQNLYTTSLQVRLATFCNVLWEYFKLIFYPVTLNYEKPYRAYATLLMARSVFGVSFLAVWLYFVIRFRKYPAVFLGLSWFFIALLPFSGIIPLNAMFLEHWLYVPIIGMLILLAKLVDYSFRHKWDRRWLLVMPVILVLFCGRTMARNSQWADIEKFYLNELKYTSESIRIFNNLGMYYAARNENNKAIIYYGRAIATRDIYPQPHHNLANIYQSMGQTDKALAELHLALKIDPGFLYSLALLSKIYFDENQNDMGHKVFLAFDRARNGGKVEPAEIEEFFPPQY